MARGPATVEEEEFDEEDELLPAGAGADDEEEEGGAVAASGLVLLVVGCARCPPAMLGGRGGTGVVGTEDPARPARLRSKPIALLKLAPVQPRPASMLPGLLEPIIIIPSSPPPTRIGPPA